MHDLGGEGDRDLKTYFSHLGIPVDGEPELRMLPAPVAAAIATLFQVHRRLRPGQPSDILFIPFNLRAGLTSLSEYDTDLSRATADGDLSAGFSPDDALSRVQCPICCCARRPADPPSGDSSAHWTTRTSGGCMS